jgi:hypothetical protein
MISALRSGNLALFQAQMAHLANLRIGLVRKLMNENGGDSIALIARALDLRREEFAQIYLNARKLRTKASGVGAADLGQALDFFDRTDAAQARGILARWRRESARRPWPRAKIWRPRKKCSRSAAGTDRKPARQPEQHLPIVRPFTPAMYRMATAPGRCVLRRRRSAGRLRSAYIFIIGRHWEQKRLEWGPARRYLSSTHRRLKLVEPRHRLQKDDAS